jgi:hypothetical protein
MQLHLFAPLNFGARKSGRLPFREMVGSWNKSMQFCPKEIYFFGPTCLVLNKIAKIIAILF